MKTAKRILLLSLLLLFAAVSAVKSDCPPYYVFTGEAAGDNFGYSVASAGDVNADGYADLIVGARWNDAGGTDAGRAYVFSGLNGDTLYVFTGEAARDFFGWSVASAGDVNADGYADLIVGAIWSGTGAGRAYVFLGGEIICGDVDGNGVVTHDDLTFLFNFYFLLGESPCGFTGDVNDDGYTDIADIVYLALFLNGSGPAPCSPAEPPNPPGFDWKKEPEGREVGLQ